MRKRRFLLSLIIFCGSLIICLNGKAQDSSIIKNDPPANPKDIVIKYGIASFYADKFNGRKTATGGTYNPTKMTAACNVLPLGTWVKVTNLKNDRSVIVQINDRLHYKNPR